eukprot:gnl/MRDRNA2_/MRDRNA2_458359_c0_seq1.p1 gnl/MRDRNA2_/MRDRNA2_458359_c0~~gnl/MRDRNA2_/MRDRNA2_458359_c0_seq1.p1  ORF type:complete len:188 (+),score=24.60 gnl/MRDRNA2_/MRDRNA2_458359_c0_seq1:76-639(+)
MAETYVDLGHHNLHGILVASPVVFGEDLLFVRIMRSRFSTACSLEAGLGKARRDLCKSQFRICPLVHQVFLSPFGCNWSDSLWHRLDLVQQAFWYIDEVEATWQNLLQLHHNTSYLECSWNVLLKPCIVALSIVLGVHPAHQIKNLKKHVRNHSTCQSSLLKSKDREYQLLMNYSSQNQELISKVQF